MYECIRYFESKILWKIYSFLKSWFHETFFDLSFLKKIQNFIQNFFLNFLKMVLRYTKNVKKIFFSIFVVFLQIWSQYLNFSWKRLENFSKNFENHHFLVQILKYMQKSDPLQPKPKKIQKNVLNKKCPQLPFGKSQKISEC